MNQIKTVVDKQRGCGWRKPGGLYLKSEGLLAMCGRLPFDLERCPCCDAGVKPTRSWTWINPKLLFKKHPCSMGSQCPGTCTLSNAQLPERCGLLWVGGSFYERPEDWINEAAFQGVSRRISRVPKGFKVGETLVLMAHRKHHKMNDGTWMPAIFHAFIPTALEYVVKGSESESQLAAMKKRGITPVKVVREGDLGTLAEEAAKQGSSKDAAKKKAPK